MPRHPSRVVALSAVGLAAVSLASSSAPAVVLYQQNFEAPVTAGSAGPTSLGGFGQPSNSIQASGFQIQGGGGGSGPTITYGVDANGAGGTQGLFVAADNSAATSFTFMQLTSYGSVAAPGAGTPDIQVDADVFIGGSSTSNPLALMLQNNGNDFSFTPTLVNGAYTHVTFLLSQTATTNANPFNFASSSNFRVQYGAGGFGFDADNLVRIDNIVVQSVPEPTALAGAAAAGLLALGRRRKA